MISTDERRGSTGDRLKPGPSYRTPVTFHYEITNHTTRMQKLARAFKVYRLTAITLSCVAAGIVLGLLCRAFASGWTERQFMYLEMPGELYLRFLKLLIIPLLVSNVVLAFGSIQGRLSSHLGKIASSLYFASNFSAIAVAILLALIVGPGRWHFQQLQGRGDAKNQNHEPQSRHHNNVILDNHHYLKEHSDSIKRYREYHPMFYHTDNRWNNDDHIVGQSRIDTEGPSESLRHSEDDITLSEKNKTILEMTTTKTATSEKTNTMTTATSTDYSSKAQTGSVLNRTKRSLSGSHSQTNQISINTKLPIDVLLDLLRNLVPDSIVEATMWQTTTRLFAPKELLLSKGGNPDPPPSHWPMGHEKVNQANIVGLLAISVLTGVLLSHMEEASKPLLDLCACIAELSLRVNVLAINLAPFCIMSLLVGQIARSQNLSSMAGELFMYFITVLLGLMIHGFVTLPLAYYFITRRSPLKYLHGIFEALVASFATSSSSATMALVLNCLTDLDLNPIVVRGFGPLGSVFNMNGTAIYQAIVTIFIAQTLGVNLPLTSILLIGVSSAVASLSTTGIPSAGIPSAVIVLNSVNLPVMQLSLIYIIDFIVDRFRTVLNVWSGAIVCGLIDHVCPEHLFEEESKMEKYQEMIKTQRKSTLISRKSLALDPALAKPQVISVTITPPPETSNM